MENNTLKLYCGKKDKFLEEIFLRFHKCHKKHETGKKLSCRVNFPGKGNSFGCKYCIMRKE